MNNTLPIVVVGIGNEFRKDDSVGLYVARLIREKASQKINIIEGIPDGYNLIEKWDNSSCVFVIDCTVSGAKPGTIYSFDALKEKIPDNLFNGYSTHSISVVEAIKLAKTLDRLPERLMVYGVEGKEFSPGIGLSPDVKLAAIELADKIIEEF